MPGPPVAQGGEFYSRKSRAMCCLLSYSLTYSPTCPLTHSPTHSLTNHQRRHSGEMSLRLHCCQNSFGCTYSITVYSFSLVACRNLRCEALSEISNAGKSTPLHFLRAAACDAKPCMKLVTLGSLLLCTTCAPQLATRSLV